MSLAAPHPRRRHPDGARTDLRVTVLYNDDRALAHGTADDRLAVEGVIACAESVAHAVRRAGWDAELVPAVRDPVQLLASLRATSPDVVFNLVESVEGEARLEAAVAWVLELARIPYTGSPPVAMSLGLDKPTAKAVLRERGVPVPVGALWARGDEPLPDAPPPWIVKPSREDASHGITTASIVETPEQARARAREVIAAYAQPALVEQFLPGREFNLAVLGEGEGAEVLAPAEIDFGGLPPGHPPLVTYEAKWAEDSVVYKGTPSIPARALGPELARLLEATALEAYRAIGLRDYGRVDLRLDAAGRPVVLEVNPNPDLSPDAGLAKAAARTGIAYEQLIVRIVRAAAARRHVRA